MKGLAKAGLFSLWIGGKPVPAGRPRVSKFGTFYPKPYTAWTKQSWHYVDALETVPTDKAVALLIEVICPAPKKTAFTTPMGDVDNFGKGPMDLLTKAQKAWLDDRQVSFLVVTKRWAVGAEEIGFRVSWCEIED